MEIGCEILPCASNITDHFKFIPFVSSSVEKNVVVSPKTVPCGLLNGEEASHFYEEVISAPSTSSAKVSAKDPKVKKKTFAPEDTRFTIFHHAQNGNIKGIEYFLSKQCHIDIQDMYGWTPLMCATFEGHYDVVEFLLKKEAKLDVKNKQGFSAIDIAYKQNNTALIRLLQNGICDDKLNISNEDKEEVRFCDLCNMSYLESISIHQRSIAHLLSCQSSNISTHYHIPENNKGFQIMLKKGWDKNKGLGLHAKGRKFPIKTVLKTDRTCIGGKKEIPKVTHFGPNDYSSVKKSTQPTLNMRREKKLKKSEQKRLERKNRQLEIDFRREFLADDSY